MEKSVGTAAALIDRVDWTAHVLGPRSGWPVALRVVLDLMLASPQSTYLVWGPERTFFFNDAYSPILGPRLEEAMGARFEDLWADAWPTVAAAFHRAEAGEASQFFNTLVPMARYGEPEQTYWTFTYSPVRDEHGTIVGVWCSTNETTAQIRIDAEHAAALARQDVLNRELSHRVKNTMAMVQAIAAQTLKKVSERDAVTAFQDRLVTLGKAHDILLEHDWKSAPIATVIESIVQVHGARDRFRIEGDDIFLGASATLSLSLLLHELATNALKYGALSVPGGAVNVVWQIAGDQPADRMTISWEEIGGPSASPPTRKGFGSRLIAMGLCGTGDAAVRYQASGFSANFAAPVALLTAN